MTKKNFCVRDAKGIISVYPISFDKDKIRLYRETSMTEALKDEHSNYTYNDEIFYSSDILFGKPTAAKLDQQSLLLRTSDNIPFKEFENTFKSDPTANYRLAYYLETNPSKVGIYRKEPFSYLLPYYNGELNNRPFRVTYPAEKYFIPLIREYDITHRLNMILQVSRIEYFLYALSTNYMEALSDITPKDIRELLKLNLFTIESNPEKSFNPDILKNYRGSLNSLREFMGMEILTGEIEKLESQAKLDTPVYQMCIKNK